MLSWSLLLHRWRYMLFLRRSIKRSICYSWLLKRWLLFFIFKERLILLIICSIKLILWLIIFLIWLRKSSFKLISCWIIRLRLLLLRCHWRLRRLIRLRLRLIWWWRIWRIRGWRSWSIRLKLKVGFLWLIWLILLWCYLIRRSWSFSKLSLILRWYSWLLSTFLLIWFIFWLKLNGRRFLRRLIQLSFLRLKRFRFWIIWCCGGIIWLPFLLLRFFR